MIYLQFLEGQGLWNQLWNYVTLRALCEVLDYGYEIINPENFKGREFLEISYIGNGSKKNLGSSLKKSIPKNIFNEKLFYDNELKVFASDFDNEILNIKSNTLIKGLFQSEKLRHY